MLDYFTCDNMGAVGLQIVGFLITEVGVLHKALPSYWTLSSVTLLFIVFIQVESQKWSNLFLTASSTITWAATANYGSHLKLCEN